MLDKLKAFPWREWGVEYALLFGSAVKGVVYRDVDIAVKFKRYSFEGYAELLAALASHLRVREDHIDLVPLNREDLPAVLVLEIYTKGVLVYCEDKEAFLDEAFRRINLSYDFLIDSRKLGLVEEAVRAVKRKWGL